MGVVTFRRTPPNRTSPDSGFEWFDRGGNRSWVRSLPNVLPRGTGPLIFGDGDSQLPFLLADPLPCDDQPTWITEADRAIKAIRERHPDATEGQ